MSDSKIYKNLIDGQWVAPANGRTIENRNPADTRDLIGSFPDSDQRDVNAAVQAAQRAYAGWRRFAAAAPGAAHRAFAAWETAGTLWQLVTQNVDGLHQRAGSRAVIDLHGRLDVVICLGCGARTPRADLQTAMREANPAWQPVAAPAPDGDADIDAAAVEAFAAPRCERCGGLLKPDVVFFGENVPGERYEAARAALAEADALLVAGSSLMVYSGFRFVRQAHEAGLPIAIVNRGRTRGDDLAELKVEGDVGPVLTDAIAARVPAGDAER